MIERPSLLSIAGFDPSGGAGILADIKTFENNRVYGLGICSALTFQNDSEFIGLKWVPEEDIKQQAEVLFRRFQPEWVKFGLIENLKVLHNLVFWLKERLPNTQIVWDPILKASAGYSFHSDISLKEVQEIASELLLITPNTNEMRQMLPELTASEGAKYLSKYCHVLLKGGHSQGDTANDILYKSNGTEVVFKSKKLNLDKHGTGCVLSSAILANLSKGYDLEEACKEGKEYITDFIKSHQGLLGYHYA
ncbi:hydroxymethylpyrimidine/phosphomethylpyrimidine kinase [Cytophagaceae bacterium ABcell3]|nr:hydroxymethylpyrimidine/phosphomethylpyrimidine kinase [Cytophagaceae bacterium ABcell3]